MNDGLDLLCVEVHSAIVLKYMFSRLWRRLLSHSYPGLDNICTFFCLQAFLMGFDVVSISLREMIGCSALTGVRYHTEHLFVIKLFDHPWDLKKSVIRT